MSVKRRLEWRRRTCDDMDRLGHRSVYCWIHQTHRRQSIQISFRPWSAQIVYDLKLGTYGEIYGFVHISPIKCGKVTLREQTAVEFLHGRLEK